MSEKRDSLIVRGVRRTRRQVDKLRGPASWVRDQIGSAVVPRVERQAERLMLAMAEPQNAQRVQTAFAGVAQVAMELGFRADRDAEQLYRLVAWLEEEHGREPVGLRVVEHAAMTSSVFRKTFETTLYGLSQPRGSAAQQEAAGRMHEVRDEVAADLLALLCSLAALECDEQPPEELDAQVEFFESAGLPDEFVALAAKAVNAPGAFEQAVHGEQERSDSSALARFVPSFDDHHLRFLTLSRLFFMQAYLTRNLIERLPELMAAAGQIDHD